jgi:S-formylglutathione hydrolase FrmB
VRVPDPTAVGGVRVVLVHRPPGPDRSDIPILYLLHGSTTHPSTFVQFGTVAALDAGMCQTGVPFVVAMPDGEVADGTDTEWSDADDHRFMIETFVTERLISEVEGDHPRTPQLRAIGGISMGGFGAASIALRHPDLYRQVLTFGGYFHVDDPAGVFKGHDALHAPDVLVRPAAKSLRWFLVEGLDDKTPLQQGTIGGEADRFAAILHRYGMTYVVRHPPGGHTFATWNPQMGAAVAFLAQGWTGS